jgi:hypothetical protein
MDVGAGRDAASDGDGTLMLTWLRSFLAAFYGFMKHAYHDPPGA